MTLPTTSLAVVNQIVRIQFSNDGSQMVAGNAGGFAIVDTATVTIANENTFSPAGYGGPTITNSDTLLNVLGGFSSNSIYSYDFSGSGTLVLAGLDPKTGIQTITDGNGVLHYMTTEAFDGQSIIFDGVVFNQLIETGYAWNPGFAFRDDYGSIWLTGWQSFTIAYFYRIVNLGGGGPDLIRITGMPANGSTFGAFHVADGSVDHFVFEWAGVIYTVDRLTGAVTGSISGLTLLPGVNGMMAIQPNASSFWAGLTEINSASLVQIQTMLMADWGLGGIPSVSIYDWNNHALIMYGTYFDLTYLFLPVSPPPPTPVSDPAFLEIGHVVRLPCFSPCVPHAIKGS